MCPGKVLIAEREYIYLETDATKKYNFPDYFDLQVAHISHSLHRSRLLVRVEYIAKTNYDRTIYIYVRFAVVYTTALTYDMSWMESSVQPITERRVGLLGGGLHI